MQQLTPNHRKRNAAKTLRVFFLSNPCNKFRPPFQNGILTTMTTEHRPEDHLTLSITPLSTLETFSFPIYFMCHNTHSLLRTTISFLLFCRPNNGGTNINQQIQQPRYSDQHLGHSNLSKFQFLTNVIFNGCIRVKQVQLIDKNIFTMINRALWQLDISSCILQG